MEVGEEGEGGIAFQAGFYGGWVGGGLWMFWYASPPTPKVKVHSPVLSNNSKVWLIWLEKDKSTSLH